MGAVGKGGMDALVGMMMCHDSKHCHCPCHCAPATKRMLRQSERACRILRRP